MKATVPSVSYKELILVTGSSIKFNTATVRNLSEWVHKSSPCVHVGLSCVARINFGQFVQRGTAATRSCLHFLLELATPPFSVSCAPSHDELQRGVPGSEGNNSGVAAGTRGGDKASFRLLA